MNEAIEPEIQENILNILPDDGPLALKVMAQLLANMIIAITGANVESFIADLKLQLALYEGT